MTLFLLAQLRLLEDQQQPVATPAPDPRAPFPVWVLLPLVTFMAGALYYQLGSVADVRIGGQLAALDENAGEEDMLALMAAIEQRSSQRSPRPGPSRPSPSTRTSARRWVCWAWRLSSASSSALPSSTGSGCWRWKPTTAREPG